jgi:uncharacterized protein (TIGR03032 family)
LSDDTRFGAEQFQLTMSRHFSEWLQATGSSLAFTTYQAGKLFLLGLGPEGRLSVFERSFPRCMGLGVTTDGRSLVLAMKHSIQRFDNVLSAGEASGDGYDAVYAPHASWVTGDLDVHDIGFGAQGRPVFINTLFSCLASVSDDHSFQPQWKPSFISRLAAEDRCHLNGLAMIDGKPAYVTAVSRSDAADGWRDRRRDGGVVIEIDSGEVIAEGLSMPHSPRWYDGKLWLLNSGTGEFGFIVPETGSFESIAFCPGYARGLAFCNGYAIVGLSLPREQHTFSGLALDEALASRDVAARCGLIVIDLTSGDITDWIRLEGVVRELYDIAVLTGVRHPSIIGFRTNEIERIISIPAAAKTERALDQAPLSIVT